MLHPFDRIKNIFIISAYAHATGNFGLHEIVNISTSLKSMLRNSNNRFTNDTTINFFQDWKFLLGEWLLLQSGKVSMFTLDTYFLTKDYTLTNKSYLGSYLPSGEKDRSWTGSACQWLILLVMDSCWNMFHTIDTWPLTSPTAMQLSWGWQARQVGFNFISVLKKKENDVFFSDICSKRKEAHHMLGVIIKSEEQVKQVFNWTI